MTAARGFVNPGVDSAKSIFFGVDGGGVGRSEVYFYVNRDGQDGGAETRRNRVIR